MRSLNNKLHGGPGAASPVQVGSAPARKRRGSDQAPLAAVSGSPAPFLYLIVFKYVPMAGS